MQQLSCLLQAFPQNHGALYGFNLLPAKCMQCSKAHLAYVAVTLDELSMSTWGHGLQVKVELLVPTGAMALLLSQKCYRCFLRVASATLVQCSSCPCYPDHTSARYMHWQTL